MFCIFQLKLENFFLLWKSNFLLIWKYTESTLVFRCIQHWILHRWLLFQFVSLVLVSTTIVLAYFEAQNRNIYSARGWDLWINAILVCISWIARLQFRSIDHKINALFLNLILSRFLRKRILSYHLTLLFLNELV